MHLKKLPNTSVSLLLEQTSFFIRPQYSVDYLEDLIKRSQINNSLVMSLFLNDLDEQWTKESLKIVALNSFKRLYIFWLTLQSLKII